MVPNLYGADLEPHIVDMLRRWVFLSELFVFAISAPRLNEGMLGPPTIPIFIAYASSL